MVVLEVLFQVFRLFVIGMVLFCYASAFQGLPVAPWLAWTAAVVTLALLAGGSSSKEK
jgi:hypothetical protein